MLELDAPRDGYLYVPKGVSASVPAPLIVFFHGAGGDAGEADVIRPLAERYGVLLLALDSRGITWHVRGDASDSDVAFVDRALVWTFDRYAIDPSRIAAAGFSDGASYALSLGLASGDLFTRVLAFSPGFFAPPAIHGRPRLFITHGTKDAILPIDRCSRRLVPRLRNAGYVVEYVEFDGAHTVPAAIAREAFAWLVG